eukprot:9483641-Pyramimonas_sp.AAC.2
MADVVHKYTGQRSVGHRKLGRNAGQLGKSSAAMFTRVTAAGNHDQQISATTASTQGALTHTPISEMDTLPKAQQSRDAPAECGEKFTTICTPSGLQQSTTRLLPGDQSITSTLGWGSTGPALTTSEPQKTTLLRRVMAASNGRKRRTLILPPKPMDASTVGCPSLRPVDTTNLDAHQDPADSDTTTRLLPSKRLASTEPKLLKENRKLPAVPSNEHNITAAAHNRARVEDVGFKTTNKLQKTLESAHTIGHQKASSVGNPVKPAYESVFEGGTTSRTLCYKVRTLPLMAQDMRAVSERKFTAIYLDTMKGYATQTNRSL